MRLRARTKHSPACWYSIKGAIPMRMRWSTMRWSTIHNHLGLRPFQEGCSQRAVNTCPVKGQHTRETSDADSQWSKVNGSGRDTAAKQPNRCSKRCAAVLLGDAGMRMCLQPCMARAERIIPAHTLLSASSNSRCGVGGDAFSQSTPVSWCLSQHIIINIVPAPTSRRARSASLGPSSAFLAPLSPLSFLRLLAPLLAVLAGVPPAAGQLRHNC